MLGPYRTLAGRVIMDKRTLNIVGAVGILSVGVFALAPAPVQSIPLGAGISTISHAAIANEPLVPVKNNGGKKKL
jgi:hypothetical protein